MTQEQRELLLKDLCGRLPYGVKMNHVADTENNPITLVGVAKTMITLENLAGYGTSDIEDYIPYLFPLSSMTPEQRTSYNFLSNSGHRSFTGLIDFYHKNHLDWRGLIPKGLALDATNKNIY